MNKLIMIALAGSAFLSGCAVVPPVVYETRPVKVICPPGQAKKANCAPAYEAHERNFCPPGQAKKGNC